MKPTLQQEEILKKYLREALLYRETYEEVYDHILTALEQKPKELLFQEAINQILNNDFGGGKGLVEMEKKCYQYVVDEILSQLWKYFKSNFKFPNLFYTLILVLTTYFIVSKIAVASFIILFLFFVGMVVPGIIMLIRYYFIGYFTLDTKKSIKDKIMGKIAGKCSSFLTLIMLFLSNKKHVDIDFWLLNYTIIFALAISLFILYILSFIKLSREEFKVYSSIKLMR